MLTADELRRLREAATPGPVEIDERYRESAIILSAERDRRRGWASSPEVFAKDFSHPIIEGRRGENKTDWDLIVYLWNHAAEIEEALRDRDRIDKCADQRIVDGIGHFDIDDRTAEAMCKANDDTEEGWKMEWRKQFRAAIDEVLTEADSAAIDAARKEGV